METFVLFMLSTVVVVVLAAMNGLSKFNNLKKKGNCFSVEADSLFFQN